MRVAAPPNPQRRDLNGGDIREPRKLSGLFILAQERMQHALNAQVRTVLVSHLPHYCCVTNPPTAPRRGDPQTPTPTRSGQIGP